MAGFFRKLFGSDPEAVELNASLKPQIEEFRKQLLGKE